MAVRAVDVIAVQFGRKRSGRLDKHPPTAADVQGAWDLLEEWVHNNTFTAIMIGEQVGSVLDGSAPPATREAFRARCQSLADVSRRTNGDLTAMRRLEAA